MTADIESVRGAAAEIIKARYDAGTVEGISTSASAL